MKENIFRRFDDAPFNMPSMEIIGSSAFYIKSDHRY
jgi:hypothetical protein